jgi:hypothetical protein
MRNATEHADPAVSIASRGIERMDDVEAALIEWQPCQGRALLRSGGLLGMQAFRRRM